MAVIGTARTVWLIGLLALLPARAEADPAAPLPAQADLATTVAQARNGAMGKIVAIAAEQHGKTVFAFRIGAGLADDPVDIRSAGKSLTALAVGAAIADGHLPGVAMPVWPFLGDVRNDGHAQITLRDLLTMSSALDCDDLNPRSPGQEDRMYRAKAWKQFALAIPLSPTYARDANGMGRFSYCTAGAFLVGQVIEKATGEPFDRYVQRRLLDPLGVSPPTWRRSPSGEVQSGGQLRIDASSLLRIGRLVLDNGRWQGQQIIPKTWVGEMLHPWQHPGKYLWYGYLWWAMPIRAPQKFVGSWSMQGNGGNFVTVVPDYDAVLVVQAENYNRPDADAHSVALMQAMVAALPDQATAR